jgi:sugar phosphate isomerase/epimerase
VSSSSKPAPALSVGEYTTPGLSFAEDLRVYREGGAQGIGIDTDLKLGGREIADAEDLARFRDSGLTATFVFPPVPSVLPLTEMPSGDDTDPDERIDAMCRAMRGLAVFEPVSFVCVTGPAGDYGQERAREIAVKGLQKVARAAAEVGATLAIEPMHSSIAAGYSFINTVPDAVALLDDIGEPNTGIMFDIWHLWDTPGLLDDIAGHAHRFVGVHVDDRRDPTRSWCDRSLPGDGIADLGGILGALDASGYDGWYELEIFSDDGRFGQDFEDSLWKLEPVDLVRAGVEKFERAWEERRLPGNMDEH